MGFLPTNLMERLMAARTLTQDRLKALLHYDQDAGVFMWRSPPAGRVTQSRVAGTSKRKGYVSIQVDGKLYQAHRLAWLYVYGMLPSGVIDHINRDAADNRIVNLRDVTLSQNARNTRIRSTNTSGYRGVSWFKSRGKWAAQIYLNGKNTVLGLFDDPAAASAEYARAAAENGLEH